MRSCFSSVIHQNSLAQITSCDLSRFLSSPSTLLDHFSSHSRTHFSNLHKHNSLNMPFPSENTYSTCSCSSLRCSGIDTLKLALIRILFCLQALFQEYSIEKVKTPIILASLQDLFSCHFLLVNFFMIFFRESFVEVW